MDAANNEAPWQARAEYFVAEGQENLPEASGNSPETNGTGGTNVGNRGEMTAAGTANGALNYGRSNETYLTQPTLRSLQGPWDKQHRPWIWTPLNHDHAFAASGRVVAVHSRPSGPRESNCRGLTIELTGRQRWPTKPGTAKKYTVRPAGAGWPAVGAPVERRVRPRPATRLKR